MLNTSSRGWKHVSSHVQEITIIFGTCFAIEATIICPLRLSNVCKLVNILCGEKGVEGRERMSSRIRFSNERRQGS